MSNNQVLIVDDEQLILKSLKRALRRIAPSWTVHLYESGQEALSDLKSGVIQPDLVMCDRLMPGTRGDDVLLECRMHNPEAIRLLMTGDTRIDIKEIVASNVHIYISKPFEHDDINNVFNRVIRLKALPLDTDIRRALGRLEHLPVLNETCQKLDELFKNQNVELSDVAKVVETDPTLVAVVLQAANSPFLGFRTQVSSIDKAVKRVGLNTIKSIAIASSLGETYDVNDSRFRDIVEHAFSSAFIASRLMRLREFPSEQAEYAFSMCMLACIGELYLIGSPDTVYNEDLQQASQPLSALITYYLLTLWGIEERLVEDIFQASSEVKCSGHFSEVFYLARRLAHEPIENNLADAPSNDDRGADDYAFIAQWRDAISAFQESS